MYPEKQRVVIATIKSWNIKNAYAFKEKYHDKYDVYVVSNKDQLNRSLLDTINPHYIFFPHWSWIISEDIFKMFKCIVFHPTDLPYGRGGTPIQNLILRKMYATKISALAVSGEIDGGDIYLKHDFSVLYGSVEEILQQMSDIVFNEMIPKILHSEMVPQKQRGNIEIFKRRKPEQSNIDGAILHTINDFYDFIRMLDGEGYPKAFLTTENFKITFSNVQKDGNNRLIGKFEIFST